MPTGRLAEFTFGNYAEIIPALLTVAGLAGSYQVFASQEQTKTSSEVVPLVDISKIPAYRMRANMALYRLSAALYLVAVLSLLVFTVIGSRAADSLQSAWVGMAVGLVFVPTFAALLAALGKWDD